MSKIFIEDVVFAVIEDMGPCPGAVGVSVKYRKDGEQPKWLTNVEVTGLPNFFLSDERILERVMDPDPDNEEELEFLQKTAIEKFSDIILGEYDELVSSIEKAKDSEAAELISYLVCVTLCDMDETDPLIQKGKGHYLNEIKIPDIKEYLRRN